MGDTARHAFAKLEDGVGFHRKRARTDESHVTDHCGNCREYAAQTQALAASCGLDQTFTLFGNPDHVFNVAVVDDKLFLIDGWNGDLMCEFTPENFYQHQSLHAIFNLSIHNDSWKDRGGALDRESSDTMAAKELLEERMKQIAAARFDPKCREILHQRLQEKIATLDCNDDYFAENLRELKFITDHFGFEDLHRNLSSVKMFDGKINPGPTRDARVTNFAIVKQTGAEVDAVGARDLEGEIADEHTLFGEGSIGKVRYAGLAYMMQEEEIIDLKQNAGEFFASEEMLIFLEEKYPGHGAVLQERIKSLFKGGGSEVATLADLTTHMAGVGDLTRAQQRLFARDGVAKEYSVVDLLLLDDTAGLLDESGKPKAQAAGNVTDDKLPLGQRGVHQYSNLGYMLLGLALEGAYYKERGEMKDYKKLTTDFMLRPVEGRAFREGLEQFEETRFPHQLNTEDVVVAKTPWIDRGRLVDCTRFSGANSAGGMFCSSSDSARFFEEFFRGFPGTPEYGVEGVNKFFSAKTIAAMWQETVDRGHVPANQADIARDIAAGKEPRMRQFQGPGFVVEVDDKGHPLKYSKGGGTIGYASMLVFDCATGVTIDMQARENVTAEVAKRRGRSMEEVIDEYKTEGSFDRKKMMQESGLSSARTSVDSLDLATTSESWLQRMKERREVSSSLRGL